MKSELNLKLTDTVDVSGHNEGCVGTNIDQKVRQESTTIDRNFLFASVYLYFIHTEQ